MYIDEGSLLLTLIQYDDSDSMILMNRTQGRKGRRAVICPVFSTYLAINCSLDSNGIIEVKVPKTNAIHRQNRVTIPDDIATNSTSLAELVGKADTWTKGWDWDQQSASICYRITQTSLLYCTES